MKKTILIIPIAAICSLFTAVNLIRAQGTAFTYQGRLNTNGSPANGLYDFQFSLSNAPGGGGSQVGSTITQTAIGVTNGLFNTILDFGPVFTGNPTWLAISVRTNGVGGYVGLSPSQQLTPTPYAIFANTAGNLTGTLPASQLSGAVPSANLSGTYSGALTFNNAADQFTGNGSGLTGVNAAMLGGYGYCSLPCYWNLGGNGGTTPGVNFVGTSDNKALEFKVNSSRGFRLEPNTSAAVNLIGGSVDNAVSPGVTGATISGGGGNGSGNIEYFPIIGGYIYPGGNQVSGDFSAVGGGGDNVISNSSIFSVIAGGVLNTIGTNAASALISGGFQNTIQTNSSYSAIGGGFFNSVTGAGDFIGGGGIDGGNLSSGFVYIGNSITANAAVISGGLYNQIEYFDYSAIAGGLANTVGYSNGSYSVNGFCATIGGGQGNTNYGENATIPGGLRNIATGRSSFAAGQYAHAMHDGAFVWADNSSTTPFASTASNQFLVRASFVGINTASPDATLTVNGSADKPGGGSWNTFSDGRLKDVGANFTHGLDDLDGIQPVHYHYKSDNPLNLPSQEEYVGVVAQQVEQAIPEAVQRNKEGYLTVNNDPIIWTMVNAIKELKSENHELKERLDRLEKEKSGNHSQANQ